ncbi:13664_t:CDS:1, partial [Gigaspora margarita]
YIEQEIVKLNQVVHNKDKEIKTFKKQLVAYKLLKQQVQQLFTIIKIDKE